MPRAPMRLILLRHGETEHNRGQVTLGRADVPLNRLGRLQAEALAASFTNAPAAIYASPLSRARDTAAAIARRCRIDVRVDEALIEMDVGEMEHLTHAELRQKHAPFLREWTSAGAADARMPGGETLREVQERAWGAIERMRGQAHEGPVVAVTHNFVILTAVCRALGLPAGEFRRVKAGIASRSIIDITDTGCSVVTLNDQSHLAAAGLLAP